MKYIAFLLGFYMLVSAAQAQTQLAVKPELEQKAKKAPRRLRKDKAALVAYLTAGLSSEADKAVVLYAWMIHHVRYDTKRFTQGKAYRILPDKTLKKRKGMCLDYSSLYEEMCTLAGIKCLQVQGKNWNRREFSDDIVYNANHAWNLFLVDGEWHFADPTFGAGFLQLEAPLPERILSRLIPGYRIRNPYRFVKRPNWKYFNPDPAWVLKSHFPDLPQWQLLDTISSPLEFSLLTANKAPGSYRSAAWLDDYAHSLPWQQFYIQADSGLSFNCRNYAGYVNALSMSGQLYLGYPRDGAINTKELPDPLNEALLLWADSLLKKSSRKIPEARAYVNEETAFRNFNNRKRRSLANYYIRHSYSNTNKVLTFSKSHKNTARSRAKRAGKRIESLQKKQQKIFDKPRRIKMPLLEENERKAYLQKLRLEEEAGHTRLDTLQAEWDRRQQVYRVCLADSVAYYDTSILSRFINTSRLTSRSSFGRKFLFDNLDEFMMLDSDQRYWEEELVQERILQRKMLQRKMVSLENQQKSGLAEMVLLSQYLAELKLLRQALTDTSQAVFQERRSEASRRYDSVITAIQLEKELTKLDLKVAVNLKKYAKRKKKKLDEESLAEQKRYSYMRSVIASRRNMLNRNLGSVHRRNKQLEASIQKALRQLNKI